LISQKDITEIDMLILQQLRKMAPTQNVIIESHAVNKDNYGFKINPFNTKMLSLISPDLLLMLYTSNPEDVYKRLLENDSGQEWKSPDDVYYCQMFQSMLALQYSILQGKELRFLDVSNGIDRIAEWIQKKVIENI
jgi:adenylate kinase